MRGRKWEKTGEEADENGKESGVAGWRERVGNGNDNEAREGKRSEDGLGYQGDSVACVR